MFTLFQVFMGESGIARLIFHDESKVDLDVTFFFVSYVFIAPVVLLNVVVAVLLDEFIKYSPGKGRRGKIEGN